MDNESLASVTVCIPTHGSAQHLREAIYSATQQSILPIEVLISDDSDSVAVKTIVSEEMRKGNPVPIRLVHCLEGSGLADNVNNCFRHVRTPWLCLIHDDDILFPNTLESCLRTIAAQPLAIGVYGKQCVLDPSGKELSEQTRCLNIAHGRVGDSRMVTDGVHAGAMQMFPNDGYTIRTDAAIATLHNPKWGAASEVDFGMRLGQRGPFYYLDAFTAGYRLSKDSIGRGNGRKTDNCGLMLIRIYKSAIRAGVLEERQLLPRLEDRVGLAIVQAINYGFLAEAWLLFFSKNHRARLLSLGGGKRLLLLLSATAIRALSVFKAQAKNSS